MKYIAATEYSYIAGSNIQSRLEFRARFDICTRTPTPDSVAEQLDACQDIVDFYEKHRQSLQQRLIMMGDTSGTDKPDPIRQKSQTEFKNEL